jgi:hypothetical protein
MILGIRIGALRTKQINVEGKVIEERDNEDTSISTISRVGPRLQWKRPTYGQAGNGQWEVS